MTGQYIPYSEYDSLFAYAINGLKLRAQPIIISNVIGKIGFGQKVQEINVEDDGFIWRWELKRE